MASSLRPTVAHRFISRLARVLVFLYPRSFRRDVQADFQAAAAHRLSSELTTSGSPGRAVWRTTRLLLADTIRSAPGIWRSRQPHWPIASLPHWPIASLAHWLIDWRLAWRAYARQPLFAAMVVATLGIGIGASAAAFGTLDRVVLRPFPFPDGDRMALVSLQHATLGWRFTPPSDLISRWRANPRTVEQIEVFRTTSVTYLDGPTPEAIDAGGVSARLPVMLGLRAAAGRVFGAGDLTPGAPPVVMVSELWWRTRLGGVPDVVGRTLRLDDRTYSIAGVWPAGARVSPRTQPDVFFLDADQASPRPGGQLLIVKMTRGVDAAAVEADLASQMAGLASLPPNVRPIATPPSAFLGNAYVRGLWLVFAASFLLTAVAVANAASLLLARAASRTRELGVRLALGGSLWQLTRMFVVESALVASGGAVVAIGVAWAIGRLLAGLASSRVQASYLGPVDASVYGFAITGAFVASLVCTLVPLFHARRRDMGQLIGVGGDLRVVASSSRLRQSLVALQAAVGVILIAGAALMARSLGNITAIDVGFAMKEIATFTLNPPTSRYPTPESRAAFGAAARETLLAIPGVTGVVNTGSPLFRMSLTSGQLYLDGETPAAGATGEIATTGAAPGYFDVMGIPLRQGRVFEPGDTAGVVIVNESFANRHGGYVVGRLLFLSRPGTSQEVAKPARIIGVVGDVQSGAVSVSGDGTPRVQVYSPSSGAPSGFAQFVIRTSTDPGSVLATARQRIAELDPSLPLLQVDTAVNLFRADTAQHRFVAVLLASLASLGVVLGVAGVYGAVSIDVRRRRREVGLRLALGATGPQVVKLLVNTGMRPVLLGVCGGVVAWLGMSSSLDGMLFRIQARDPLSALGALGALILVAAVACLVAARHASRVDPAVTLRAN